MAGINRIFVVGYPKSGNTWLTRLLARALNAHVAEYTLDRTNKEMASDVNREIEGLSPVTVCKVHLTPQGCATRFPIDGRTAVVYVRRNPCAVLVSAFFYYRYKGPPDVAARVPALRTVLNPRAWVRHLRARRELAEFLDEFVDRGVGQHLPWNVHVREWEEYLRMHPDIPSVDVAYEKLIADCTGTLRGVVNALELGDVAEERIEAAVELESFKKRKKEILQSERDLTFGKSFNVRFLRAGRADDYQNYLTKRQVEKVQSGLMSDSGGGVRLEGGNPGI